MALRDLLGHFVDVCHAVEYAHSRGVIHRDLKPSNVMLGRYGETLVVDWGLAKSVGRGAHDDDSAEQEPTLRPSSGSGSSETVAGQPLGTPAFASPEQMAGKLDEISPLSDVYGLGATLFALLTGEPPFKGTIPEIIGKVQAGAYPRLRSVNPSVPAALEAICARAMSFRPDNRYAQPSELAADINAWLADEPVEVHRDPLFTRWRRWLKRHRGFAAAAAAITVAVAGLSVGMAVLSVKNRQLSQAETTIQTRNKQLTATNVELEAKNVKLRDAYRDIEQNLAVIGKQQVQLSQDYEEATRSAINIAIERGQWQSALDRITEVLDTEPFKNDVGMRLQKVRTLNGLLRTREAYAEVEALSQLTDKSGHEAMIDLWHGDMMLFKNKPDEAQALIQQALDRGLPTAEQHYARALLGKDTLQVIADLRKAIELDLFHQRAYHVEVSTLILMGRRDEAIDVIDGAENLFPNDRNFTLLRALIAVMSWDKQKSLELLGSLQDALDKQDYELAKNLFDGVSRFSGFMDHWDSGLSKIDLFHILKLLKDMHRFSTTGVSAKDEKDPWSVDFRPANVAMSAYATAFNGISLVTLVTGSTSSKVANNLTQATQHHPDGLLHFVRGEIYCLNGLDAQAVEAFEKAATLPALIPNVDREAWYCLCMEQQALWIKAKDPKLLDAAVESLRRRLTYGPLRASHAGTVWGLCVRQEQWDVARTIAKQQVEKTPDAVDWLEKLAMVERRSGHLEESIRLLDRILILKPGWDNALKLRDETVSDLQEAVDIWRQGPPSGQEEPVPGAEPAEIFR